jgi:hypothetical protein
MPGAAQNPMSAMTGKNARLIIFQDGEKTLVDFKTWTLKPNVTKHNDGINGDDSDELDYTFNYWEIAGQLFARNADWLRQYLTALAARQANTSPLAQQAATRFYPNDGTKKSFVLVGLVWDDFDANQGGRSEKFMVGVNLRCRKITEAKTI